MKISGNVKLAMLLLALTPVLEAADKPLANQQIKEKVNEIIARDQKGESLENITEREIEKQRKSKPPTGTTSVTTAAENTKTGPSRLEIWKKQHEQKKTEIEEKQQ